LICIYAIINIIDDKQYVGQAKDRDYRWKEHRKQLRGYYHHNLYLQRAWCKYGESNFVFVVLEVLDDASKLNERETYWANLLKAEYNIAPAGGSMRGYKHTDEARANMSKANKTKHSKEHKQKMSERMKGNQFNTGRKQSLEHIEKRAIVHRGKITSEETKAKISASNIGQKRSEEARKNMSTSAKNKPPVSEETRKKLSEAAKKQWQHYLTEI